MQHEVIAIFTFQRVDDLFILTRAQRGHRQRLCFTTGEQG